MESDMIKRLIHFRTYRKIHQYAKADDWKNAHLLAKQVNDKDLTRWCALARCVQLLSEME